MKGKGKETDNPWKLMPLHTHPFTSSTTSQTSTMRCSLKTPRILSPCLKVAFLELALLPTCLSWALWGIFRRPLWWRCTQPLSSSASLGNQKRETPPCQVKAPTFLTRNAHRREQSRQRELVL